MKPPISAHSPFMPGQSGRSLLAVCDEAAPQDLIQTASHTLEAAMTILYFVLTHPDPAERLQALYGVVRLLELAAGMIASLQNT